MLQWFIRFPKFTEFLYHLGKTPLYLIRPKQLILIFLTTYMYKKNSKGRHSDCNYSRVTERQTIVMWKMQKQSSHEGYFHNGCSPNWALRSILRYLRHLQQNGIWEIVLIVSSLWKIKIIYCRGTIRKWKILMGWFALIARIVELSKVAFPKGSFPLNKVFNCQCWHFIVNIAHIYWDHKSYKSIFWLMKDCTTAPFSEFAYVSLRLRVQNRRTKWNFRLIFGLCVNCLISIPEYSRLNHLDVHLVWTTLETSQN